MTPQPETHPMLAMAGEAATLFAASQQAAVALFQAEVKAIGALLGALPDQDGETAAARRAAEEAAVEAAFDNMPV